MKTDEQGRKFFIDSDMPKLRRLYNKALKEKKEQFVYEGNDVVTDYAKYVLEYYDIMKAKNWYE